MTNDDGRTECIESCDSNPIDASFDLVSEDGVRCVDNCVNPGSEVADEPKTDENQCQCLAG